MTDSNLNETKMFEATACRLLFFREEGEKICLKTRKLDKKRGKFAKQASSGVIYEVLDIEMIFRVLVPLCVARHLVKTTRIVVAGCSQ
jgi:hypothetical protein